MADIRESVVEALVMTGKFDAEHARLAERARYCCEYCDREMLKSVEDYKLWQKDHIVPICAGGTEDFDNLAIACRHCNWDFKRDWDPRKAEGLPAVPRRDDLIKAAQGYIKRKKAEALLDLERVREIVVYPFSGKAHA